MFQRMIDDFKESTGTALRLTSLAGVAVLALLVTTSFLCAAAFVYVLQNYGLVQACLTGAAVFFVVTLIAAGCYMVRKNRVKARAAEAAKSAAHSPLADPMLVATGLQCPRHRSQEADSATGGRRPRLGHAGKPQRAQRRAIGRLEFSPEYSGHAAAGLKLLGHFGQYADHGLAGDRRRASAGLDQRRRGAPLRAISAAGMRTRTEVSERP